MDENEKLRQELFRERMRREAAEKSALRHERWAEEAREEKRKLQRYFDDAGGEGNLIALLDVYDERRREAVRMLDVAAERDRTLTAELDENQRIVEAARSGCPSKRHLALIEAMQKLACAVRDFNGAVQALEAAPPEVE